VAIRWSATWAKHWSNTGQNHGSNNHLDGCLVSIPRCGHRTKDAVITATLHVGRMLVKNWSNNSRNAGQTLVKYWSNNHQDGDLVSIPRCSYRTKDAVFTSTVRSCCGSDKCWSRTGRNAGQILVKYWSNSGRWQVGDFVSVAIFPAKTGYNRALAAEQVVACKSGVNQV
jgi:hypothetical protein